MNQKYCLLPLFYNQKIIGITSNNTIIQLKIHDSNFFNNFFRNKVNQIYILHNVLLKNI